MLDRTISDPNVTQHRILSVRMSKQRKINRHKKMSLFKIRGMFLKIGADASLK